MLGNAVLDEETNKKSIFISDLVTVSWLNEDEALLENNGLSWEHPFFTSMIKLITIVSADIFQLNLANLRPKRILSF